MQQRIGWMVTGLALLALALAAGAGVGAAEAPVVEGLGPKVEAATTAAESWLALVDDGKYAESWETAGELFKKAVTQEDWENKVAAVREPLGGVLSRKVTSADYRTTLPGAPDGEYVVIEFETSFENKASASERVTPMRQDDGSWRVTGYYIR